MKRRPLLRQQAVKKKRRKNNPSTTWKIISLAGSYFVKFSCLMIVLAMISLLFVSLYEYLRTSPHLRLEQVIFEGVDGEIRRELIQMSGLNLGSSLLAVNLNELKQRMERHPWIRSIDLERRFPHTLVIEAEKEKPWAVVAMDKLYYMNRWGNIFKEVDQIGQLDYPVITGVPLSGNRREKRLKWAAHVLRILESERQPWSMKDLSELHLKNNGDVSLYFSSLPAVIQSRGSELGTRMGDLKKVVKHLNDTGRIHMVKGINLNYRDGAVVSFKGS